jgi:UDP-galactopyranose mutase
MKVVDWLSEFTDWTPYKHKVKAMMEDGRQVTLPVNLELKGVLSDNEILDTFFRPYTKKMWNMAIEDIDASVLNRVAIRNDLNEFYFPNDSFQAMPTQGYTKLVENILDHKNIKLNLETLFDKNLEKNYDFIFNSMPIDEYFDFKLGELPYRSIKFTDIHFPAPKLFNVSVVNFTHDGPNTRVTEWKNFPNHGVNSGITTLTIEEPCDYKDNNFERYYPVKDIEGLNRSKYLEYANCVPKNMRFIGRCGQYAYLDMHQAISSALAMAKNFISNS